MGRTLPRPRVVAVSAIVINGCCEVRCWERVKGVFDSEMYVQDKESGSEFDILNADLLSALTRAPHDVGRGLSFEVNVISIV